VDFYYGYVYDHYKSSDFYVRAVRKGDPAHGQIHH
jgi:hypothetical protein